MSATQPQNTLWHKRLLTIFLKLVLGDASLVGDILFDLIQRLPLVHSLPGMYEVLEYEASLELKDSRGVTANYHKRQKVRFLQDNIIAYQDKAWGDGDIFAAYHCSPGEAVDRYRDGHRYNILISLRETKHRGDVEEFNIQRVIKNGFIGEVESFQTDIDHRTRKLTLSIIFPKCRRPTKVMLIEQNTQESLTLDHTHIQILPDGRHRYRWETAKPHLFEAYILRWEW